jgi:hypothetical protein
MSPLSFDVTACEIIAGRITKHPGTVLRLEIDRTYSRGSSYCTLKLAWATQSDADRDQSLVRWQGPHGVQVYVAPRLWRYLAFHALAVSGRHLGFIRRLSLETEPRFLDVLSEWEQTHPTVGMHWLPAA